MMYGKIILLLALVLTLISSVPTAIATLNVAVIDGTAIPYAKEDHLAYGTVKMWNKADTLIAVTLSLTPDRNHLVDDNKYWGNYREEENIKIGANELHIQIFCFTIPTGSELGQQTWTLNVTTADEETITKKVAVNLPVTKNVEIVTPSWKPDILKLELPPGKPDTFTVEADKPTVIVALLDIAGDLNSRKIYDVELETTLPDIFFSYPEEIVVEMSRPKSWDFKNQTFLPFTVIPVPLLTANVPYSYDESMYELELQLEEEGTDLKANLPFQLVVTMPSPTEKTIETEVIKENMTAVNVNETVNDSKTAVITEAAVAVNSSGAMKLAGIPETNNRWTWSKVSQLNDDMWNFIINKMGNFR